MKRNKILVLILTIIMILICLTELYIKIDKRVFSVEKVKFKNGEIATGNETQDKYNEIELMNKSNLIEDLTNSTKKDLDVNYYESKQLIVNIKDTDFDSYNGKCVNLFNNTFLISYETEEDCKIAYNNLIKDEKILSVEIDSILSVENQKIVEAQSINEIEKSETELSKHLSSLEAQREIKVAILDTGITSNENIKNEIIDLGINLSEEENTYDNNGHGTEIAEIISLNSNTNVKLMPIKIADKEGKSTVYKAYMGIKAAIENGADIINISMNTYKTTTSQILTDIINEATAKGVIVVTSSGNDGINTEYVTPSNIESAIVVSAINENNSIENYSNYGETVDFTSYGKYNENEGTSYAAANVTGIIANVLSRNQDISILDDYAVDLGAEGKDIYYGQGFLGMEMNKNSEDIIPEDYFENTIFDIDWKNLDDEKLNEYLEKAEEAHVAIFIQNLSKEDLDLILSKNTILTNDYIKYDYILDENGNKVVDEVQTEEDGTEDVKYKIEEKESMPYYEYLLNLDFSSMTISAFTTKNGYFTLRIYGGGIANSSIRIKTAIASTDKTKSQDVTYSIVAASTSNNHGFALNSTSGITKKATGTRGNSDGTSAVVDGTTVYRTKTYIALDLSARYTQPAYTYPSGEKSNTVEGTRMNFQTYNWQNSNPSTVGTRGVYTTNQIHNIRMSVHTSNAGHSDDKKHGILTINCNYPLLYIYYNANGGTGSISQGSVAYNGTYTTKANTFARTGYHAPSGSEWGTATNGGTKFSANKGYAATTLKSFTNGTRFGSQNVTLYAQWVPNTYTVVYNGNGSTGGSTANSGHTYNQAKTLTANGFTRSHTVTYNHNYSGSSNTSKTATYSFKNWNTAANGSGTSYGNSTSVSNLTSANGGTVNLYAQWTSSSVTYTPTRTGYTFGGWYTTSSCTGNRVDNNGSYTPTAATTLYAKWQINNYKYTVNYLEKGTNKVLHTAKQDTSKSYGTTVVSSNEIINIDGYKYDNSSNNIRISEIENNNIINIYYTKRTDLSYKVNYLEKDGDTDNSNNRVLHEPKLVQNQRFEDIINSSNEVIQIDGFNFDSPEHKTIQITTRENVINLYYTKRTDLNYIVNYFEKDDDTDNSNNRVLHEPKLVENQMFENIIDSVDEVIEIDGFYFDSSEKETIKITTGQNIINLYYTKRTDLSYRVNYLEKDEDTDNSNNRVLHEPKLVESQIFEDIINTSKEIIEIDGFNFDSPEKETIQITTGDNIINLYYTKRTDLSYTVNYLEKDEDTDNSNNRVLHEPKLVENQRFEDIINSSNEVIEIDGFNFDSPEHKVIQITTGQNVINLYYTKRIDLNYTVNYLEKDEDNSNNRVLHESKLVEDQMFENIIDPIDEVIEIDGFNFDSPEKETIQITTGENVINLYYTKRTDLSYMVNYLEKDEDNDDSNNNILRDSKLVENQRFEDIINTSEEVIEIDGFMFDSSDKDNLEITTGENIITLYYTRKDNLSYTVNYLEKDEDEDNSNNRVLHEAKVVEDQIFEDIISASEEVIEIDGFEFDSSDKEIIEITTGSNVINLYYTKKADLNYTVNYLEKDEDTDNSNNRILHEPKFVDSQIFEDIINSEDEVIEIEGFKFDSPEKETIKITTGINIINLYYAKREDLSYTVNYLEKDEDVDNANNKVIHEAKIVENQRFEDIINASKEVIDIYGYAYDSCEKETIPMTTDNISNVINLYYIVDEGQTKELSYTVEYYKEGTKVEEDTQIQTNTVQALETEILEVEQEAINIEDKYYGYKLGSITENDNVVDNLPETVENGTVIKVNYIIDEEQTKELSYTVEYYKEGIKVEEDTQIERKTVQVLEADILEVDKESISIENKYVGYKLEKIEPENIPDTVNNGEVIKVYYVRDKFNYIVEYYYDGEQDETKKETLEATYQDEITEYTDKNIPGYKLEKVEGLPLTIKEYAGLNVIKVYYVKDQFDYTVNYYYDGIKDESKTATFTVTYKDVIDTYEEKLKDGYRFERAENLPLEVSEKTEENIINIYYVRKDATCVVKYVDKYNEEEVAEAVTKSGKVFDNFDVSGDVKEIEGYTLVESPEEMTGTFAEEEQTRAYYYAKNTSVVVKYLEKDEEAQRLAEEIVIEGYEGKEYNTEEKEIENYTFVESTENTSGTMAREEVEVIYYYLQHTKVTVNYIDKNTEETLETVLQEGLVGDTYRAVAKDIEDYVFEEGPENELVTMTKEEIILNYYYLHISSGVIEKHIDINTNEVLETILHEGNENDSYITEPKTFEGYDLVEDKLPENAEGKMAVEEVEVNYYYIRKMTVRVEYIDKVTEEKISEDIIISGYENDNYVTEEKEFEKYNIVQEMYPENVSGIMKPSINSDGTISAEVVVRYYYIKKAEVIEKHMDVKTGEIIEVVRQEGEEKEPYKTEAKDLEGYDIIEERLPVNAEGEMGGETIVVYYYVRKANVIVEYIDKSTGKIIREVDEETKAEKDSTEKISGHEGESYETTEKQFKGYKLKAISNNKEGEMQVVKNEDGTVNVTTYVKYYYAHMSKGIKEEHIDIITGEEITKGTVHEGYEGDTYRTYPREIKNYALVKEYYPENAEGEMSKDELKVKYYYVRQARVIVEYIDKETQKKIIDDVEIRGHEDQKYSTKVKVFDGYKLFDKPENAEGTMKVIDDVNGNLDITTYVRYYYIKSPEKLKLESSERQPQIINIYNNMIDNGQTPNKSVPSEDVNSKSSNSSAVTNNEKTPNTGDILPIVIPVIIFLVAILNVLYTIKINKKNFIK